MRRDLYCDLPNHQPMWLNPVRRDFLRCRRVWDVHVTIHLDERVSFLASNMANGQTAYMTKWCRWVHCLQKLRIPKNGIISNVRFRANSGYTWDDVTWSIYAPFRCNTTLDTHICARTTYGSITLPPPHEMKIQLNIPYIELLLQEHWCIGIWQFDVEAVRRRNNDNALSTYYTIMRTFISSCVTSNVKWKRVVITWQVILHYSLLYLVADTSH